MTEMRRATASPGPCAQVRRSPFFSITNRLPHGLLRLSELAVALAVSEVDGQADDQPHAESQPVRPAQTVDHRAAHDDAGGRDQRQRGNGEAATDVRPAVPHDPDAGADQDE